MRCFRGPLIAVLAGTMFVGGTSHASPLRFTAGFRWFDTGRVAEDVVAADLDGDGTPDLVVSHPLDDAISVLLGAPGGGFRSRIGFAAGPDPRNLAAFDADRDGHIDVVVTNRAAGTTSLLRGRGDGTLASPRALATLASPGTVLAKDLDGDGIIDLVLSTGAGEGTVVFARGRGDGSFAAPVTVHEGAGPVRLVGVDLPGARRHGLAVAAADGLVTIYATTPSGRFRAVDELRLPGVPTAICTLDADGDGRADLVVAVAASAPGDTLDQGSVRVLRGSASGRFLPGAELDAGFVPSCVSAVDIDGDGWSDIVAPDRRGGGLGILQNDHAGGFQYAGRKASRLGPGRPAAGDWNCDGRIDLSGLESSGRAAVLLAGQGDGIFGDAVDLVVDFGPVGLWLGDVDDDGVDDLAATALFTNRLAILRGDGAGGFAPQSEAETYATGFTPERVHAARLRPGGPVDLVIAHSTYDGFLSCGRNRGDGTFTFAPEDTVHTGGRPSSFILGDVDADGVPDAVVGNSGTGTVAILRGDGLGWFRLHTTLAVETARPVALALGDLDGDAHIDLAVVTEHAHSIRIFHGTGGGDFTPGQQIAPGLRPLSIALADLDADGDLDLVTGQGTVYPTSGLVVVYRGDGHGTFAPYDPAWTTRVGWEPARLLVLDLDGDGRLDLVTANHGSSTVTVVPGPTARGFSFDTSFSLGTQAAADALVAGDVDRDGRPDLLFAGRTADRIGLLRNLTGDPGSFRPGVTVDITPGSCPNPLAAGDGLLRVALVSGGAIDFADLLAHSVRLAGVAPLGDAPEMRDESGPVDVCASGCACDGRAPDGVLDAIYTFDATAILAAVGATREGESRELRFTAHLRGGGRIDAVDCVVLAASSARSADEPAAGPGLRGPNPLSSNERIRWSYAVPAGGAEVRIGVFNVAGRRVARLVHGFEDEGAGTVTWTPRDDAGRPLAPGMYFLRAEVGTARSVARLVLVP